MHVLINERQPLATLKALIVAPFYRRNQPAAEGWGQFTRGWSGFLDGGTADKRSGGAQQHLEPVLRRLFRGGERRRMRSFRGTIVTMVRARRGCLHETALKTWRLFRGPRLIALPAFILSTPPPTHTHIQTGVPTALNTTFERSRVFQPEEEVRDDNEQWASQRH